MEGGEAGDMDEGVETDGNAVEAMRASSWEPLTMNPGMVGWICSITKEKKLSSITIISVVSCESDLRVITQVRTEQIVQVTAIPPAIFVWELVLYYLHSNPLRMNLYLLV